MFDFLRNLSWAEWIIIGLILFIIFGSRRVSDISRRLGSSHKELKKVKQEINSIKEEVA